MDLSPLIFAPEYFFDGGSTEDFALGLLAGLDLFFGCARLRCFCFGGDASFTEFLFKSSLYLDKENAQYEYTIDDYLARVVHLPGMNGGSTGIPSGQASLSSESTSKSS